MLNSSEKPSWWKDKKCIVFGGTVSIIGLLIALPGFLSDLGSLTESTTTIPTTIPITPPTTTPTTIPTTIKTTPPTTTPTETIFVMGDRKSEILSSVERFNTETNWRSVRPMPGAWRWGMAVAVLDNLLYAIGGYNNDQYALNTVDMYNPSSGQWTSVESMNIRRFDPGAAAMGGLVYVVGGKDENSIDLDTVESYNVTSGQWSKGTSMTQVRSSPGVVELGGRLYAMGGYNNEFLNTVEFLDVTNTWSPASSMNTRRKSPGAATLRGKIYVAGGTDGSTFLRSVEMFDPSENVWRFVASMKVARYRSALVNGGDGKLYVIGVCDGYFDLSSVEMYSPETDTWADVGSMESCAGGVGVGVMYT